MKKKKAGGGAPEPGATEDLTCKRLVLEALYDFEAGTMPAQERAELERHLSLCPPCVLFLDSYRATGRTLRTLRPREIPPMLARTVFQFVKARCGRKS